MGIKTKIEEPIINGDIVTVTVKGKDEGSGPPQQSTIHLTLAIVPENEVNSAISEDPKAERQRTNAAFTYLWKSKWTGDWKKHTVVFKTDGQIDAVAVAHAVQPATGRKSNRATKAIKD